MNSKLMHCRLRLFLFCAALTFSFPAQAQSRIECNATDSRILKSTVHYCVYLPASYAEKHSSQKYPVLYFLHGLGDNERTLSNSGGWTMLDELQQQDKMGEFLIVAPEGGATFYINSADGSMPYSDFFLQEFIPVSYTHLAVLPEIWRLMRPRRWMLALGFVLMLINRVAALVLPYSCLLYTSRCV